MKTKQTDPVDQPDGSSASTVELENDIQEVPDSAAVAMPKDFKEDFFKQKQLMRDAQAQNNELAERVKAFEEKEAERVGNHKKIIETLKEENASLKESITVSEKRKKVDRFNETLILRAKELGFTKPERIKNFLSDDDKALLTMDDDYNIDEYGLEKAFDNVKKEWSELFRPKNIKFADGVPKTNLNEQPKKSASQMTSAERIAMVKELTKNK